MNKANEMYEPMRNLALSTKAETVSSMLQGGKTTVYGVILEENRRGVYSTTLGLSDGHSSNYVSKGSTVIGGGGNINSKTQSMFMVGNVKKDMFTDCPQPEKVVLPEEGEVSFIVLSTLGRFNCRLPFSEISDSEWREVYNHGAKLKEALNSATY